MFFVKNLYFLQSFTCILKICSSVCYHYTFRSSPVFMIVILILYSFWYLNKKSNALIEITKFSLLDYRENIFSKACKVIHTTGCTHLRNSRIINYYFMYVWTAFRVIWKCSLLLVSMQSTRDPIFDKFLLFWIATSSIKWSSLH